MTPTPADFPWRPRMLAISNGRPFVVLHVDGNPDLIHETGEHLLLCRDRERYSSHYGLVNNPMPDPTDPATIGALLGAVREAHPDWPVVCLVYRGSCESWQVVGRHREYARRHDRAVIGKGPTEFDALMAAWNARPVPLEVPHG